MSDESNGRAAERLDQDLRALRVALRAVEAPDAELALVAALHARKPRVEAARAAVPAPKTRRSFERRYAALATAATGVLATLTTFAWLYSGHGAAPGAVAPTAAAQSPAAAQPAGAFRPLSYGPGLSPGESYSIVRVRIPLSSLAHGAPLDGSIEAELLVGEDGLASGIRFNPADTLVVSALSP